MAACRRWMTYCHLRADCLYTGISSGPTLGIEYGKAFTFFTLYIHFRGLLLGAKFPLRPSLSLSCIGSVIARHSSSGRQPNFAALNRGRHRYSAGRPSRWASAHILVLLSFFFFPRLFSAVADWMSIPYFRT